MGIFNNIFRKKVEEINRVQDGNNFSAVYEDDFFNSRSATLESIFKKIARDISSDLKVKHVSYKDKQFKEFDEYMYELNLSPNLVQTAYDFYYMITYQMIKYGYCLCFIVRDEFFVLDNYVNSIVAEQEKFYITDKNGENEIVVEKSEVIVMRLDPVHTLDLSLANNSSLKSYVDLIDKNLNALSSLLSNNGRINAFIKLDTNIANQELSKAEATWAKSQFKSAIGGIGFLQKGQELVELKKTYEIIDKENISYLEDKLYEAFGLNKDLFTANYSEQQYSAYFKTTLKPILKILQQSFNKTLFSKKEFDEGKKLLFLLPQRDVTSLKDYTNYIHKAIYSGYANINELRIAEGKEPVDGGDINYTNANAVKLNEDEKDDEGGD